MPPLIDDHDVCCTRTPARAHPSYPPFTDVTLYTTRCNLASEIRFRVHCISSCSPTCDSSSTNEQDPGKAARNVGGIMYTPQFLSDYILSPPLHLSSLHLTSCLLFMQRCTRASPRCTITVAWEKVYSPSHPFHRPSFPSFSPNGALWSCVLCASLQDVIRPYWFHPITSTPP